MRDKDPQAKYQLAVMYYDGMGVKQNQALALKLMKEVACSEDPKAQHLVHSACFNIGMAFLQGLYQVWGGGVIQQKEFKTECLIRGWNDAVLRRRREMVSSRSGRWQPKCLD